MNPLGTLGRAGVRAIDYMLSRYEGIFIFCDDPACLLRLAPLKSPHEIALSDGTCIARGEPVLELHLWNEQLPELPLQGGTLAWGANFLERFRASLRQVADYMTREPRWQSIRALHAEMGFLEFDQFKEARPLVERLGFDMVVSQPPGWHVWTYAFWANVFSWWMVWTFNPASLQGKHFSRMARCEFWISRTVLMKKYGGGDHADPRTRT